jgi:hypothetical protein
VNRVLNMPEVVKSFAVTGVVPAPRSTADTEKFVAAEFKTYAEVVKKANVPTF